MVSIVQHQKEDEPQEGNNDAMKRSFSSIHPLTSVATSSTESAAEQPMKKKQKLLQSMVEQGASKKLSIRPSDYAKSVFKSNGHNVKRIQTSYEKNRLQTPTLKMVQSYLPRILNIVRCGDLKGLEQAYNDGVTIQCCNRFGESLLHLACRRSHTNIVRFLLEHSQKELPNMLHLRDDYQRTPLHDACWTAEPNFELVDLLLRYAPEQIVMEDVRGNTPFDYVRPADYGMWLKFIWERKSLLQPPKAEEGKTAVQKDCGVVAVPPAAAAVLETASCSFEEATKATAAKA
jgi:hypothetical protein